MFCWFVHRQFGWFIHSAWPLIQWLIVFVSQCHRPSVARTLSLSPAPIESSVACRTLARKALRRRRRRRADALKRAASLPIHVNFVEHRLGVNWKKGVPLEVLPVCYLPVQRR